MVRSLTRVDSTVHSQSARLNERLSAFAALKGSFFRVDSIVSSEIRLTAKGLNRSVSCCIVGRPVPLYSPLNGRETSARRVDY